ncbi:hypothetical protein TMatcc_004733 [Talaromyces marneffei ATCC 18224]
MTDLSCQRTRVSYLQKVALLYPGRSDTISDGISHEHRECISVAILVESLPLSLPRPFSELLRETVAPLE